MFSLIVKLLDQLLIVVTQMPDGIIVSFAPNLARQFKFSDNSFKEISMGNIAISITELQKITVGVESDNALGKPAPQQAGTVPSFATDVKGVVTTLPSDSGNSLEIDGIAAGVAVITVNGIAIDGAKFSNTITVTVTVDPRENEATNFKLTAGTPTDQ